MLQRAFFAVAMTTLILGAAVTSSADAADETGTLKMKFVYGGPPPTPAPIDVNKDVEFCGKTDLVNEALLVNPENAGIKNVVVYVYTGRGGSDLPEMDPKNNTHELANDQCRFEPHIVIMQSGDTLKVTNPDAVGHNANISFFRNDPVNFQIPPKGEKSVEVEKPEPAPIPVACNIHPWMKAYVLVLEHPFAAKSNENGELEIKGLPTGDELVFRVYVEAASGSIDEVKINGETTKWRRNRFEMEIEPGVNDMGTIEIPALAGQ